MTTALSGIRVLDLSRILAGPWATQTLADLGADVIKVERPGRGDDTRTWGPPYQPSENSNAANESAYFLAANRGKKSIALDITSTEGQLIIRELIESTDILVENFKVGGLKKYGLDYERLRKINPRLIYCSITGFGQTGPYSHRPGYDFMLQGMGGLMSITGEPDNHPGGGPVKVGVATADIYTGLYSTIAIMGALRIRDQNGVGEYIDMSLLDVQVAVLANQASNYLVSGQPPGRLGNAHPNIVPYQAFATEDGHLILAVGNDSQFRDFCIACDQPDLAKDERFTTNPGRVENRQQLVPIVEKILRSRATEAWLTVLESAGVPCGPINNIEQVFEDPQVKSRELHRQLSHASCGSVPSVANPIRYTHNKLECSTAPPALGQHTETVLKELGLSQEKIEYLYDQGIIT